MARIPTWLKRPLLPLWNGAHHLSWRAAEYADALWHRRFERCAVCGRFGPMLYRRRVIPPRLVELWGLSPRLAEALARRESCDCAWCGAKLRARRLALVLLQTFPLDPPARSVAEWARRPETRPLRVAEINRIDGLHDALRPLPGFIPSDYQPGAPPGAVVDGVRSEDLSRLSYPDASFDLVLTSETLEHVPDLAAALRELWRVLVPGGWHLFTIPQLPDIPSTFTRTLRHLDGTLEHLAPRICHPSGDQGYLVFTEFGADWPELLEAAGFTVSSHFGPPTEDDLAQVYVCRKRVIAPGPSGTYVTQENGSPTTGQPPPQRRAKRRLLCSLL